MAPDHADTSARRDCGDVALTSDFLFKHLIRFGFDAELNALGVFSACCDATPCSFVLVAEMSGGKRIEFHRRLFRFRLLLVYG